MYKILLVCLFIVAIEILLLLIRYYRTYLGGGLGGDIGPWQMLTQPLKQQSPWLGQSVSLTPGLQQVLV